MLSGWNALRNAQKPLGQPLYDFSSIPRPARDLEGSSVHWVDQREQWQESMAEMLLLCKEAVRRLKRKRERSAAGDATANDGADSNPEAKIPTTAQELARTDARVAGGGSGSKPLSLDYLADRLDVDEPVVGYMIRTAVRPSTCPEDQWRRGMLQGFITVTTFTTWQKTLCWDSRNAIAYACDEDDLEEQRLAGLRAWDEDGSMADELQQTVRAGNVHAEGIVWPRIAEISLLGALSCGRVLVSLVVEHLEGLKASGEANYDFVVLQATENSISFYESMGFVRVGAVMRDEAVPEDSDSSETETASESSSAGRKRKTKYDSSSSGSNSSGSDEAVEAEPLAEDSPEKANAVALPRNVYSSEVTPYTATPGETPDDIAKRHSVDVWDIIFLNKGMYEGISPSSRLKANTVLYLPKKTTKPASSRSAPQWYVAKENDTPRMIARQFNVNCLDLVETNKARLPDLVSSSRLRQGTRVQVSHLGAPAISYKPYAHWSFPDDELEDGEPSYMMVRKLVRRLGNAAQRQRPVAESLAVPITSYESIPGLLYKPTEEPSTPGTMEASPGRFGRPSRSNARRISPRRVLGPPKASARKKRKRKSNDDVDDDAPSPPKRPLVSFFVFAAEQREKRREEMDGLKAKEKAKLYSDLWRSLSESDRSYYEEKAEESKAEYKRLKKDFDKKMAAYKAARGFDLEDEDDDSEETEYQSDDDSEDRADVPMSADRVESGKSLYNSVVRLKPGAMTEGSKYLYWYVLTYIPDLQWCHLAPMIQVGTFGSEKPKAEGRPKYKLVDESLGFEVDISASYCIPVKTRSMKRTLDADKEEWDILDDDPTDAVITKRPEGTPHPDPSNTNLSDGKTSQVDFSSTLIAVLPGSRKPLSVRVVFDTDMPKPMRSLPGKSTFKSQPPQERDDSSHDSNSSRWPARRRSGTDSVVSETEKVASTKKEAPVSKTESGSKRQSDSKPKEVAKKQRNPAPAFSTAKKPSTVPRRGRSARSNSASDDGNARKKKTLTDASAYRCEKENRRSRRHTLAVSTVKTPLRRDLKGRFIGGSTPEPSRRNVVARRTLDSCDNKDSVTRPKRKAAPGVMGENLPVRKRLRSDSCIPRRSVLQS